MFFSTNDESPAVTRPKMPRTRRVLAGFCLALVLLASAGILAARRSSRLASKPGQPKSGRPDPSGSGLQTQDSRLIQPQSSSPSKQYVYVGGKLIATVEGATSPPPPASGQITLSAVTGFSGGTGITLLWTFSGSGQQNFKVERKVLTDSQFSLITTVGPTSLSCVDLVPAGNTYQYQVVAASSAVDSAPSNIVTVNVPSGPPSAPTSLNAIYNSAGPEVDLTWTPTSNNEDGFKLERAPSGGSFAQIAVLCKGSARYVDKPISGPSGYSYQVKAYNEARDSAYSTTPVINIPAPAPVASMVSCGTSVQISWTESATVDSFTVFRNGTQIASGITPTPPTTTFTDSSAPSQALLSYTVLAHSANFGDSPQSNSVTCTTPAGCQVTTFSGNGTHGYQEGQGTTAAWANPIGETAAIDPVRGNHALFICDTDNQRIRMVYLDGPNAGLSVPIAGNGTQGYGGGHGDAMNARFSSPQGITAITNPSNVVTALIVADTGNNVIRELTPPATAGADWGIFDLSGNWSVPPGYQDGNSSVALFNSPEDVIIGNDGLIDVVDTSNSAIRQVDLQGNTATTANANSGLGLVVGITVSRTSGLLYVADQSNNAIWQVTTGGSTSVLLNPIKKPYHLAWASGDVLYIANRIAHQVIKAPISPASSSIYAGTGAQGWADGSCTSVAQFNTPQAVAIGPSGELYIADSLNNRIRRIQ